MVGNQKRGVFMFQSIYRCVHGGLIDADDDERRICDKHCWLKMSNGKCGNFDTVLDFNAVWDESHPEEVEVWE